MQENPLVPWVMIPETHVTWFMPEDYEHLRQVGEKNKPNQLWNQMVETNKNRLYLMGYGFQTKEYRGTEKLGQALAVHLPGFP